MTREMVKKGKHSVGVTRQYCGQVGKQENCRVAVSLSVSTAETSLPIAWRLYLPEVWTQDKQRRKSTGVPPENPIQTKPEIALQQIRTARDREIPAAPVLTDAAMATTRHFARALPNWVCCTLVGIQSSVSVWKPGHEPLPSGNGKRHRTPHKLLRPRWPAQSACGTRVGDELTGLRLEDGAMAGRKLVSPSGLGLRPCAYVLPIATIGAANPAPRSGC